MDKKLLKLFGQRIRQIRMLKKLSQEQLALMADLHRTYIGMIERGEKNITLLNIEKLSNALAIEMKELFIFDNKDV